MNDIFSHLSNRRILILGFGSEGKSSLKFISTNYEKIKPKSVVVADEKEIQEQLYCGGIKVETVTGADYLQAMSASDLVLKSPGIVFAKFHKKIVDRHWEIAEFSGVEISCQMDLFLRYAPGHIVGVTGTKGKSTTTSLVYEILRHNFPAEKVFLLGNIGVPVWDHFADLDNDSYCAVEMSAHQLEFCQSSPDIAIMTNLYPEHLDHYKDYDDYAAAKLNILAWQSAKDRAVFVEHERPLLEKSLEVVARTGAKLSLVKDLNKADNADLLSQYDLNIEDSYNLAEEGIFTEKRSGKKFSLAKNPHLLGRHNQTNALAALAAARNLGVEEAAAIKAISNYKGLEHRLEYVGQYKGIIFYNDSIATIPKASELAIKTLDELAPVTTILIGGLDRSLDYSEYVDFLYTTNVNCAVCFPDTGVQIAAMLAEKNKKSGKKITAVVLDDMHEAVRFAYTHTKAGEICLLSPAAASYNKYKNFEERGRAFKEAVKAESAADMESSE